MKKRNLYMILLIMAAAVLAIPMAAANAQTVAGQPSYNNPLYPPGIGWNPYVDYSLPQWSQSPSMRKFVNGLPGLGLWTCTPGTPAGLNGVPYADGTCNQNNLGQYIPIAQPDTTSYAGADYYEIGAKDYHLQMNSDMPGNCTTSITGVTTCAAVPDATLGTKIRGMYQKNGTASSQASQFLGPAILAHRDRPVRVKFFNELGNGAAGNLFVPVDATLMGAYMGPTAGQFFNENRVTIPHLHGGLTPWISDGTPHQWLTPAGDTVAAAGGAVYQKGASFVNVPDMVTGSVVNGTAVPCVGGAKCFAAAPGDGIATLYWTNQQSQRLMFYHDHAWGTTRLNPYVGMAAAYILTDQVEEDLLTGTNVSGIYSVPGAVAGPILPDLGGVYHWGIPLVVQDKAFVHDATTPPGPGFPAPETGYKSNALTATNDPLWYTYVNDQLKGVPAPNNVTRGGDFWFPHEYLPVENPFDPTGNTPWGRWDYGLFMNPAAIPTNITLPSPSTTPEAFVDTAVVNGTAFPYVDLPPDAVRFRILAAGNDRVWNLQLYKADPLRINVTSGGSGYTAPVVTISGGCPSTAACTATLTPTVVGGVITGITVANATGFTHPDVANYVAPVVTITDATGTLATAAPFVNTEVKMVDAAPNAAFPSWPRDGRDGGVPDPLTSGPSWIHIGNETGWLAQATVLPPQPVDYEYNRQVIPFASVNNSSLLLLPAMRADVVVDFSSYTEGDTLILYNDAPAAMSFWWPNNDYYTDCPDITAAGAQTSTPPGFGPNTRTVMQIRIKGTKTSTFNFGKDGTGPSTVALKAMLPKVFAKDSDPILVPQIAYNDAYPVGDPLHFGGTVDNYMTNIQTTYNVGGGPKSIAKIKTVMPGNNYAVAPTVMIVGGGQPNPCVAPACVKATATAGLNPMGGITLLTAGTGYTSTPTVALGAPTAGGVQATAVATISGGLVTAITIDEPGSNYTNAVTAPTCTITGGGGTGATCSVMLPTLNTVGSITLTNPGAGYTAEPLVYLIPAAGSNGIGATADALLTGATIMTGKMITEGFDNDYGRMDIRLGSVPNPLAPAVGNGMVVGLARYIDPPTEILNDSELVLWRLGHLGVDSHALHFHLFNVQVVNRVDWTNVVKPPYEDEIGWRETIRTNPMEDILVAIRPYAPSLPFPVPNSNRLLDPSTTLNSTANFLPVAPPAGVAAVAQLTNVMTNFNWEYVWHCHMLGHEENDFMRPMVFVITAPVAPSALTAANVAGATLSVKLSWNDNSTNEKGFTLQRATNTGFTSNLKTFTLPAVAGTTATTAIKATYTDSDPALVGSTRYYYRVRSTNAAGNSAWSNVVNLTTLAAPPITVAPVITGVAGAAGSRSVILTWPALTAGQTGFVIQRATNATFTAGLVSTTVNTPTLATRTVTGLRTGTSYYFRVAARNATGTGTYSNVVGPIVAP